MAVEPETEQRRRHAPNQPLNERSPLIIAGSPATTHTPPQIVSGLAHQVVEGDPHQAEGADPHQVDGDPRQVDGDLYEIPRLIVWLKTNLSYFFTDLPKETINYINMPDTIPQEAILKPQKCPRTNSCSLASLTKAVALFILVIIFRLTFIIGAIFTQLMTCFRRDWINTNFTKSLTNNNKKMLSCDDKVEVICGLLIPDIVIVLLAFWVYFGLRYGSKYCCGCCGWKELNVVMRADTAESLNILVQAAKDKLKKSCVTITYTLIPMIYIILSLLVSVAYFLAFKLVNEDVIIKPPLGGHNLGGDIKYIYIGFSFLGFIALDLLYLRVMLKYAYRCQLIIYYLKIIKQQVKVYADKQKKIEEKIEENSEDQEIQEIQEIQQDPETKNLKKELKKSKKELMKKTETAYTFIKDLNASSSTIALLIILAGFQAVNCAINLLCQEISYLQAGAVMARLLLWGFLLVFPFHKAAGINIVYKQLRDLGWDMKRQSLVHDGYTGPITLKARMFGISVNPWLPYLVTIALLFTIMAGAKIKWYQLKM